MNARTLSASTLAVLAFTAVALSQTQPTANNPGTDASSRSLTVGLMNDSDNSEFVNAETTNKSSFLKPFVGTWKGAATLHGAQGADSSSEISCTSVLTFGHYLTTNFNGKIMGEAFEAVQTWGFNTDTNSFETTWIDNNSTGITFNNGTANEDGTVLTIDGQVPGADGTTITQRSVTTLVDQDHFTLDLVSIDSQNVSTPVMTISFTRQLSTAAVPVPQAATTASSNTTTPTVASNTSSNVTNTTTTNVQPAQVVHRLFASRSVIVEVTSDEVNAQHSATVSEPRN